MAMRPVPSKFPVSQGFYGQFSNKLTGGSGHGAIDFACPVGTPVVAPEDGTVVFASWCWDLPGGPNGWLSRWYQLKPAVGNRNAGGGIMTIIRNDVGSVWILAHLNDNNIAPAGTRVKKGQVIGYSGNTGSSTGPHLHVGLVPARANWSNGFYGAIDPSPWLTEAYQIRGAASNAPKTTSKAVIEKYSYNLDTSIRAANRSPRSAFGHSGPPTQAVIHWWNSPDKAGTLDATARHLASKASGVSAHFVISGRDVKRLVDVSEAAWHAGHGPTNGRSVGFELDPRNPAHTLETVAQIIHEIEVLYGVDLEVIRHMDVSQTGCPGIYRGKINEIVSLSNGITSNKIVSLSNGITQKTTKDEFDMASLNDLRKVLNEVVPQHVRGSINHYFSPSTTEGRRTLDRIADAVLDRPVDLKGEDEGKTSIRTKVAYQATLFREIRRDVTEVKKQNEVLAAALVEVKKQNEILATALVKLMDGKESA